METRKFTKRREMVDLNNVTANLAEDVIICLPVGLVHIVRKFLRTRATWRTTYVKAYLGDEYEIPSIEEMLPVNRAISQFLEDTNQMNCNDLIEVLQQIAANQCCGESGGSGGASPETPPAEYTDDGETPPEGFPDYETYDQHKCDAAQWFIDGWVLDMQWFETIDIGALTVTGIALGLVTPGVNVVAFVALATLLLALGAFIAELDIVIGWIGDNGTALRCAIYNSADAATALAEVVDYIEASALTTQQQEIAKYWATQAAMNKAFSNVSIPATLADCSACGCPEYFVVWGTEVLPDLAEVDSENTGSREQLTVKRHSNEADYCGGYETLQDIVWLSGKSPNYAFRVRAFDQDATELFDQDGSTALSNFVATLPRSDVSQVFFNRGSGDGDSNEDFTLSIDWSL